MTNERREASAIRLGTDLLLRYSQCSLRRSGRYLIVSETPFGVAVSLCGSRRARRLVTLGDEP